jgi:hypothetical protein
MSGIDPDQLQGRVSGKNYHERTCLAVAATIGNRDVRSLE